MIQEIKLNTHVYLTIYIYCHVKSTEQIQTTSIPSGELVYRSGTSPGPNLAPIESAKLVDLGHTWGPTW